MYIRYISGQAGWMCVREKRKKGETSYLYPFIILFVPPFAAWHASDGGMHWWQLHRHSNHASQASCTWHLPELSKTGNKTPCIRGWWWWRCWSVNAVFHKFIWRWASTYVLVVNRDETIRLLNTYRQIPCRHYYIHTPSSYIHLLVEVLRDNWHNSDWPMIEFRAIQHPLHHQCFSAVITTRPMLRDHL